MRPVAATSPHCSGESALRGAVPVLVQVASSRHVLSSAPSLGGHPGAAAGGGSAGGTPSAGGGGGPPLVPFGHILDHVGARRGMVIRTWNAASLLASACRDDTSLNRHRLKLRLLDAVVDGADVVLLQDVRGCAQEDLVELDLRYPGFVSFGSFCAGRMAGGVVTMVTRQLADSSDCHLLEVVPGRVSVLRVASPTM